MIARKNKKISSRHPPAKRRADGCRNVQGIPGNGRWLRTLHDPARSPPWEDGNTLEETPVGDLRPLLRVGLCGARPGRPPPPPGGAGGGDLSAEKFRLSHRKRGARRPGRARGGRVA